MPKYSSSSSSKRKYILPITLLLLLVFFLTFFKIPNLLNPGTNIQDVISTNLNLPNDKILGLSKILNNENSKNQDEIINKIEKLNKKFFQQQEIKLKQLEEQNKLILKELKDLKVPISSSTIREKLTFAYSYNPESKFPAYIWQTWKHGLNDERFDEKFRQGETQWALKNPGFVHEIFNDDTAHTMIKYLYKQIPEVIETYEILPEVILKMDFFKYLILFAKGGVYADIDTYPIQPIPNWTPENVSPLDIGMTIAVEIDSNSPNWRQDSIRRLQFGQFVIQAKPGHPILREIIAEIIEFTRLKKLESMSNNNNNNNDGILRLTGNTNQKSKQISQWTGSSIWTDVILKYFNDYILSSVFNKVTWKDFHDLKTPKLVSDILVLPINSFASDIDIEKDGGNEGKKIDHLAFVKHYSAKIWKSV
ncbi:och1 [Candida pseudojiufengensis]|uniref:och1 n=1 Tax=Candida pseudojiufengensis TaxID=497109 RepID=UPI002225622D|nr:och1 [Candida pseudojiufengensis]KAI5963035.1 och1 [Candida pseudojiufengensis]